MVAGTALAPRRPHPSLRRRLPARLPDIAPHEVVLRPFGAAGPQGMILTATEADFLGAMLDDLAADDAARRIAARRGRRRGADGVLELHLPIHRRFQLVLFEAFCRTPGSPRLDPRKLDGSGLVLRRIDRQGVAGWVKSGTRRLGWRRLPSPAQDPDPARRPVPANPAARALSALLAERRGESVLAEDTVPLFPAPPALCARLGRTLLYGIVPVASAEEIDGPPPAPDYAAMSASEAAALRQHLSGYLKPRPAMAMPRAGQVLSPAWRPLDSQPDDAGSEEGRLNSFAVFLQQLLQECAAFEATPEAAALRAALDELRLPMARDAAGRVTRSVPAGAFCAEAAAILVAGEANPRALAMPLAWPEIGPALGARLSALALACLPGRFAALSPPAQKFEQASARYQVQGFIRVRGHVDCPPTLVWSEASEPFRILPWWEGDGPATKINLPDISDLRRIKPGVAVQMPPSIANLLRGDAKKLAEGEGSTSGLDLAWICSFSIPAITICAFIVLSIFLSLLNLIFGWLAWIRICIPVPKPK